MLPTRVEGLAHETVATVACAESHTAALTSCGAVYTWGRDRFGQVTMSTACLVAHCSVPRAHCRTHPLLAAGCLGHAYNCTGTF